MRTLLIVIMILFCGCDYQPQNNAHQNSKMLDYLDETKILVEEEQYAEALERCIWFHKNALKHDEYMSAVRLSHALTEWWKLGDIYPPAKEAYIELRNHNTQLLKQDDKGHATLSRGRRHRENCEIFVDVAALNKTMGEPEQTLALFQDLDEKYPALAHDSWFFAASIVIDSGEYTLARKYIPDFQERYKLNLTVYKANRRYSEGNENIEYSINSFVEDVLRLIKVAVATGDMSVAKAIQSQALKVVNDKRLQIDLNSLQMELTSTPQP